MTHPEAIRRVLQTIHGGRVLDVASGIGQFTRLLVDCLGSYETIVGIDTSNKAIEKARATFRETSVHFEFADATALPFPDASFHTVSLSNSLHHMEDLDAVLSEIRRVTIPGGQWIVFEMYSDGPTAASQNAIDLHLWAAAVDRALGRFHAPVLTHADLIAQLDALGLLNRTLIHWFPEDETGEIAPVLQIIDQLLKGVEGTPDEKDLATEADILKERIQHSGMQSQPFVLAVGSYAIES